MIKPEPSIPGRKDFSTAINALYKIAMATPKAMWTLERKTIKNAKQALDLGELTIYLDQKHQQKIEEYWYKHTDKPFPEIPRGSP